jgi:hypothetical protein
MTLCVLFAVLAMAVGDVQAHGVAEDDKAYFEQTSGVHLSGVLSGTHINPYLVDTIIGFSVVYKALDNMGALERLLGFQPNTKAAVLIFGLFHGFGLATKLQELTLSQEGLVPNILAFNVGVEIGQMLALSTILIAMGYWRRSAAFERQAFSANGLLMVAGFVLMGYQLTGYATV